MPADTERFRDRADAGRRLIKGVVQALDIPADWIEAVDAGERRVLERMNRDYRGDRPPPELAGRTVLVDEGATAGETMVAAVRAVRLEDPARVVVCPPPTPARARSWARSPTRSCACARRGPALDRRVVRRLHPRAR